MNRRTNGERGITLVEVTNNNFNEVSVPKQKLRNMLVVLKIIARRERLKINRAQHVKLILRIASHDAKRN